MRPRPFNVISKKLVIAAEAAEALERNILPWMSPTQDSIDNSKYKSFIHSETYMSITFSKVGLLNCHFTSQSSLPTHDNQGDVSLEIATKAAEALERNALPWMSPTQDSIDNSKYKSFKDTEAYMCTHHCHNL